MQALCPTCGGRIGGQDLNVVTDVALCRACDQVFVLSELAHAGAQGTAAADLTRPPRGTWFVRTFDGFELGATTRSHAAWFLVPFMCVWSGGSLGGIYGTQIVEGQFDLFRSLFGIPFVLGTLLFASFAVMMVGGKVAVRVSGGEGRVFTGVGPFGWTRKFDWRQVRAVREELRRSPSAEHPGMVITLDAPQRLRFAGMLRDVRLEFVADALRQMLRERGRAPQRYTMRP